jgi:hypothetical protein
MLYTAAVPLLYSHPVVEDISLFIPTSRNQDMQRKLRALSKLSILHLAYPPLFQKGASPDDNHELRLVKDELWAEEPRWSDTTREVVENAESQVDKVLAALKSLEQQENPERIFPRLKSISYGANSTHCWEIFERWMRSAAAYRGNGRVAELTRRLDQAKALPRFFVQKDDFEWCQHVQCGPLSLTPLDDLQPEECAKQLVFTMHLGALAPIALAKLPVLMPGWTNRLMIDRLLPQDLPLDNRNHVVGDVTPLSPSARSMIVHTIARLTFPLAALPSGGPEFGTTETNMDGAVQGTTLEVYGPLRRQRPRDRTGRYGMRFENTAFERAEERRLEREEGVLEDLQGSLHGILKGDWVGRVRLEFLDDAPGCSCGGN